MVSLLIIFWIYFLYKKGISFFITGKKHMVTGLDHIKVKKTTWKNKIQRDVELLQGAYFGGTPEHIIEEYKQKQQKKTIED
jgi:hypothetical protein